MKRQARAGRGRDGVGRGVDQNRVAVGIGLRDRGHADGVARARPVFHDDRLSKLRRSLLEHGARHDVGRGTWCERHDGADRLARPGLRPGVADAQGNARENAQENHGAGKHQITHINLPGLGHDGYSRLNVFCNAGWRRNWKTVRLQPVDMKTDGFADLVLNRLHGRSGGNATREVWYVSRIVAFGLFDHDRVTHQRCSLRPACFKMLFKVPGATSSDGLPATVTRPGFLGCLYWRWLPRVATRNQPSASISLTTSRTFMPHHPLRTR